ncbi:MAG TPA: (4Fe-4S)-binding protein [Bacteroidales bacterium]|nr:(4Fe-4S)-binding protein [Bacteroidales bacterium]
MKEIVVISGKGGTGKTSVTASFAVLAGDDAIIADCDVDAADMHLLMNPEIEKSENFFSGVAAKIDENKCTNCSICADVCRFNAISVINNQHSINSLNCEGCGYCEKVCPVEAISMQEQNVGDWYISKTKIGNTMVHAKLGIGAENSGKLVAKVKNEAKRLAKDNNKDYIIIDGSPGIGCPVVSSLSGASYVVLVTEPSLSGLHDLKRAYTLVKKFNLKAGCIINKYDINTDVTKDIIKFLNEESINHIASLPYDENFTKAMTFGQTIVEYDTGVLKELIVDSWKHIKELVKSN